jgi:hypothetical protein
MVSSGIGVSASGHREPSIAALAATVRADRAAARDERRALPAVALWLGGTTTVS